MKRRNILKGLTLLPLASGLVGKAAAASLGGTSLGPASASQTGPGTTERDLFKELGVTPVINASVTMTFLSGSLMLPEVLAAINSTSHDFADMYELQDKVGAKIAEMLQVESAMVTSGASCAILLSTAASITGMDPEKIRQLPNLPGPRPEVIMQKTHRYLFDQAVTTTGAKIIEVEGPDEMEKAINERTVMALFFNAAGKSSIQHSDFVAIAKRHNIPTLLDAAADVPPVENLFKYQKIGFDLVTFSGGKMIRGPQSAGLLFGRKDLITAARANHSPNEAPIGRPMKVNKEEMFGMYAALKAYLERDHKKEWEEWLQRTKHIGSQLESLPTVKTETYVDPGPANAFPSLHVTWDQSKIKISPKEVVKALKGGTPSIVANGNDDHLTVGVVLLRPDQIDVVSGRVKSILQQAI
jgi:L-seryl-tRNA(Ser) seleniumtransferase